MPQTLPWPKMPNIAGIRRRVLPSRSLYCACRYFTTACAMVRRMVSCAGRGVHRGAISFRWTMSPVEPGPATWPCSMREKSWFDEIGGVEPPAAAGSTGSESPHLPRAAATTDRDW